jgi:hypothetical protein
MASSMADVHHVPVCCERGYSFGNLQLFHVCAEADVGRDTMVSAVISFLDACTKWIGAKNFVRLNSNLQNHSLRIVGRCKQAEKWTNC